MEVLPRLSSRMPAPWLRARHLTAPLVHSEVVASNLASSELSYLITGTLEIIPQDTGVPVIVKPGDFVTFPEGFVSDWTVLEELTWHYYLY